MNFDEKTPPLWHAFNALDISNTGNCSKGTLKVLTFNVASALCVLNAEKTLDEFCETDTISFSDYLKFLRAELFVQLEEADCVNANLDISQVDQVCWYVCSKKYLERPHKHMNNDDVQKLWSVFNFLSEKDDADLSIYPVVIDKDEVAMVISDMLSGLTRTFEKDKFDMLFGGAERLVPFERFLDLVEHKYCEGLDLETIHVMVDDVYEKYIIEVYKKGMMYKRSPKFNNFHERYFVLTPACLSYYTCREKKDCKGSVPINANVRVMMVTSTDSKSKPHRIQIMATNKTYELSAHDNRDKVEWLHALDNAIKSCNNPYTPQKKACLDRRRKRHEEQERQRMAAEEHRKKMELERIAAEKQRDLERRMEQMQQDLEREKLLREQLQKQLLELENLRAMTRNKLEEIEQQRQQLEGKLHEETSQREQDEEKLKELAQEHQELERQLLEEATVSASLKRQMEDLQAMRRDLECLWKKETQAREDEEKVRHAAVVALGEEMEKREETERMKAEIMKKSQEDHQRSLEREREQQEKQERELKEAEERLKALEIDRKEKEAQLQIQEQDLRNAEQAKKEMELRLAQRENLQNQEALTKINALKVILNLDPNAPLSEIHCHRGKGAVTDRELDAKAKLFRNHSAPSTSPIAEMEDISLAPQEAVSEEQPTHNDSTEWNSEEVFSQGENEQNKQDVSHSEDGQVENISENEQHIT